MIDIYTHGSQVGLSIHGLGGLLLLSYFVLDVVSLFVTKSLIIHKILIWFRVRREVKKLIPNWWKIDKVNLITIERLNTGYKVYVQIRSKLMVSDWTNDHIIVDWLGGIKNEKLIEGIKWYDDRSVEKIKQRERRDSRLNQLGI
jgi:hypothetical protein